MTQTGKTTRAQRMAMPLARDVVKDIAISHGGCIRPVQLRRTDLTTGETEQVLVPCGHTLASVCPACAERAKNLRAAQCREGWHLDREPDLEPDPRHRRPGVVDREPRRGPGPPRPGRSCWGGHRGPGPAARRTGRGNQPRRDARQGGTRPGPRRHRSTRRRQDAPPLPRRKVDPRTVGKTYTTPDGKTFRPSLFLTLTCPSYGRVTGDGTPGRPGQLRLHRGRAGRAALRRAVRPVHPEPAPHCGYDLQYFAAIEPQRRLAPHVHMAIRGTVSRRELREVIAATYHQVWWPSTAAVRFDGTGCRSGTRPTPPTWTRKPARCCPPGTRRWTPSATRTSRCTSQGSGPGSTPRACWPDRGTRTGASAT